MNIKLNASSLMLELNHAIVLASMSSLIFTFRRMDTVMTMDPHALTGMLRNLGAQMLKARSRNGVHLSMYGAMLTLLVKTPKKLFTSKELIMKESSTGDNAQGMLQEQIKSLFRKLKMKLIQHSNLCSKVPKKLRM